MDGPPTSALGSLTDRRVVLARANDALAEAREGHGSTVFVEGPAGIGKSELLGAIVSDATAAGMEVLAAAGRWHESGLSFGVTLQLFDSRLERAGEEERARLFAEAAREAVPVFTPGRRRLAPTLDTLHGLYRLCGRLASSRPLVLVVDDADLADTNSLRLLAYLSDRISEVPIAAVLSAGSVPPGQAPDVLEAIREAPSAIRLPLAPFTLRGTMRRVTARRPDATEDACLSIHRASAGYPFLIDALTEHGSSSRAEPKPAIAAWALRRASQIHDDAPGLLAACAVLGPDAELRHAAALAELDIEAAAPVIDLLAGAGILKPAEVLCFEQPVVEEAIDAFQAGVQRAAAHLRAASLLHTEEDGSERVARHLLRATRTGSDWVVDALCTAAAVGLGRGSPATAAEYLRRALSEPPPARQRAHVVLELGKAEAMAGEPQAPNRLSQGASEYASNGHDAPDVALVTGRTLFALGRPEHAMAVFEQAAAQSGPDPAMERWLLACHAIARRIARPSDAGVASHDPPPATVAGPGDRALLALHAFEDALRAAPCTDVRDLAVRALGNGALLDDETADGMTYYLATVALALAEDLETAEIALSAAVEDANERGSVLGFATASAVRAGTIFMRGRVTDAASDARSALAVEPHGWRLGLGGARLVLAHSLIEGGDLGGAAHQLEMADATFGEGHPSRMSMLATRGRVRLLSGDAEGALHDFLAAGEFAEQAGVRNPAVAAWRSGAGLASAALGDTAEAERLIAAELSIAESFGTPRPIARALRAMASTRGRRASLEMLEAAVEVVEDSQAALERARALVEFGSALRRSGRRREARAPLRAGLDLAQRCGAAALAQRAMNESTAAGARPRRAALSGVNALTPRERQVASLAAEGLSNRAIAQALVVTVKTVEWHLKHSYRKLGVQSRQQLGELLGPDVRGESER